MKRPVRGVVVFGLLLAAACAPSSDSEVPATPESDATEPLRTPPILQSFDLGGDFVLAAHDGTAFDLAARRGEVFLMFFGYTHCPDFCPATLSLLGQVHELLGEDGGDATTLLVTIDPDRDTPEALAKYLGYFGVPALGLSGTAEELTYIYLIDHEGAVRYMFRPNDTPEFIAAGVREQIEIARAQS